MTRPDDPRAALRADCAQCFGLCCVATTFTRSADFAFDKPAGEPCRHLGPGFGCSIHADLRERGMPGCTTYDCFGAGQRVAQVTYAGRDWRARPETAAQMYRVFGVMRDLHELLWHLTEARAQSAARELRADLDRALDATARLAEQPADALETVDVTRHRGDVARLLRRASELVRAEVRREQTEHVGADLVGQRWPGADLVGADLRGALLIGADLRGADLRLADLIGADLRGALLAGADLSTSLFLTQFQVNAAHGDAATLLPGALDRPAHWSR